MRLTTFHAHRRFLALLTLFITAVMAQRISLPTMEGGDEYLHFNYVQYLVSENHLPERSTYLTNSMRQQSGQPPLVYWAASLLVRIFSLPVTNGDQLLERYEKLKNPWYAPPNPWNRTDNRNLLFHDAGDQSFVTPEVERAVQITRFTALGFGILAVIGAYGAAREVFARESWALTATAIFAFTPQMVHISSFVTTDVGATAFSTVVIWQGLRLLRCGASPARLVVIGALLGLGGLSKVNVLLVTPAVAIALVIDWRKHQKPMVQFIANGLMVAFSLALIFGPWVIYGLTTYQDPIGTRTHLRPGFYYDRPLNLIEITPLLPEVYLSYWGKLASAVYLHPVTYTVLGIIIVLALAGFIGFFMASRVTLIQLSSLPAQRIVVLLTAFVASTAGLLHWLQTIHFITGRLMYTGHISAAIGITGGLYVLARRQRGRWLQIYTVGVVVASSLILAPVSLYTAYAPPAQLTHDQLPALQGSSVDFDDTIRFLGYTQDSAILSGDWHTIKVCWEVLQSTERPAAFSVKLVHDGQIIADRTSVHGMGRYLSVLWKPGDIFCDTVEIPIITPPQAGRVYDVLLVMLDARTQAVDWQATASDGMPIQYPFIAQLSAS